MMTGFMGSIWYAITQCPAAQPDDGIIRDCRYDAAGRHGEHRLFYYPVSHRTAGL